MPSLQTAIMLLFILSMPACAEHPASTLKFEAGAANKRGHEDITRYGVEHANKQLATISGTSEFYPLPAKGVAGIDSGNQLIRGNFATDFPEETILDFYHVQHGPFILHWLDWHESPRLQHLHGLRNRVGPIFADSFTTCQQTTGAIVRALHEALSHLRADPTAELGRFWLGHATHIIQDTFSRAHTIREGRTLVDHCTYGLKDPAICYHNDFDARDKVWKQYGGGCEFDPNNRNWACLVPEAQAAAMATAGFLTVAGRLVLNPDLDPELSMRQWLNGDPGVYESGYLDCRPLGTGKSAQLGSPSTRRSPS